MRMTYCCVIVILCLSVASSALSPDDQSGNRANIENLKILRKSVNFAYKLGNDFLNFIRGGALPHEAIIKAAKLRNKDSYKLNDIMQICLPYIGYCILIIIGLLFAIFMPIVGFCFCLCRCAGKCGGKVKGMDPKHAICKRYTYAFFLGIISVIMLAGIVLAFINNQLIHDTLTNPSEEISAIKQVVKGSEIMKKSLINITIEIENAETSPSTNNNAISDEKLINELTKYFLQSYKKEAMIGKRINEVEKITKQFDSVLTILEQIKKPQKNLLDYSVKFKDLAVNLQDDKIEDYFKSFLKSSDSKFSELKSLMKTDKNTIKSTGQKLKEIVKFFNMTFENHIDPTIETINKNFKIEYLEYRMYICIGVCCLILLIVLFYFLGLCFGQCGERPFEDARICNRGVGANLMMAGVAFAFLFTPTIMVIEIVLFVYGGMAQTEVCRYLTNSYEPGVKGVDYALQFMKNCSIYDYPSFVPNNTFETLVTRCPSESMTAAFNIDRELLSTQIYNQIDEITNIAKDKVQAWCKTNLTQLFNVIDKESFLKEYENFDQATFKNIKQNFEKLLSSMQLINLEKIENDITSYFTTYDLNGFKGVLVTATKSFLSQNSPYDNIKCTGMHNATKMFIDAFCVTVLWPFNGFWYGVGICLVFTIPAIIFAVKLAGLYRHTEKYSADYEEPDYNSYMGFYTNNAENIPMKKSKPGKNNQKNRNSNFNNKDSLKQTNPQYLPVYPYDAYE